MRDFKWAEIESHLEARLHYVLTSWVGTSYHPGWQCKGAGVDCVRFVCGVLDELYGVTTPIETLPPDTAMHNARGAVGVMHKIKVLYKPNMAVRDGTISPGDVVVMGPRDGGPGHALIAGPSRNTLWHSTGLGVQVTGLGFADGIHNKIYRVFRCGDRDLWAR